MKTTVLVGLVQRVDDVDEPLEQKSLVRPSRTELWQYVAILQRGSSFT